MGPWTALLVAYLIGGVTFVPLLVGFVLLHAHYTLPFRHDLDGVPDRHPDSVVQDGDDTAALDAHRAKERGDGGSGGSDDDGRNRRKKDSDAAVHEMDVAAGYFAVCREYTAMGINAKPIERSTPVGTATVAPPSPSVYQTMYRSIFDRKPVQGPIENHSMSHRPKKAGNVFYVVLRHGHIMLFDDEEQLEVRHVISLAHYTISIYSGGDETPEGELFIKRNALCLTRRDALADDGGPVAKPFYLFSENCSAKEDFYFALLKNQEQTFPGLDGRPPRPKHFDIKDIITLVQRLHSSEENIHSRWINALLGRLFLSVYRTKDLENFIASKIAKKISRVKTPSYLTNIAIRKIDTGEAAPFFHNLRLKEFTVDGECVVETDMRYTGQFRLEVEATAKIDLGTRIKAREVNLVLALVMRRIEGHMLFKIKPPPSNRLWLSFQTMPKMELAIEPVVSSRQITYTVILRQIENRIKEVFAETLVQPFWDDVPFFRTEHKQWRGGIFEGDDAVEGEEDAEVTLPPPAVPIPDGDVPTETAVDVAPEEQAAVATEPPASSRPVEKSQAMPTLENQAPAATGLFGRRLGTSKLGAHSPAAASAVSLDAKGAAATTSRSPNIIRHSSVEPVVGTEAAHADWFRPSTSPPDHATSLIAALHSKAQQEASSPLVTPVGSPVKYARGKPSDASSVSSKEDGALDSVAPASEPHNNSNGTITPPTRRNTVSSHGSASHEGGNGQHSPNGSTFSQAGSIGRKFFMKRENTNASIATTSTGTSDGGSKRNNTLAAVTNVANQARQWGWNAIQRQKDARRHSEAASSQVDLSQPMGRGQPLPPPGMPLPGPTNGKTKLVAPIAVPKRKPVPPASVPEHAAETIDSPDKKPERPRTSHSQKHEEDRDRDTRPPLPQRRRRAAAGQAIVEEPDASVENVLVISAPDDSEPPTPMDDGDDESLFAPAQDDGKMLAAADGIPRKPVPVPVTVVKDVADPEADSTPIAYPVPRFSATEAGSTELPALDDEDLPHEDGKPLVAMPLSTTPPEATVDEEDDDGFAGWMDEDNGTGTPPLQAEGALPPPVTSLVQ
ncbi:PH domain-containing [Cordyceps militaris]|uniref:PH domain-containing n=1 Tax=Cordyceps militaris TaxID=73501 RepID=A0A2H4SF78_CORMI|nr:PH domain-containing [Cordyceps militaris]